MKIHELLARWMTIFGILMMLSSTGWGVVLDTDTFNTDKDEWNGTGESWDSANARLAINRDQTGTKTFTFPGYANQVVTVSLLATKTNNWESSDVIQITANGMQVYNSNTAGTITFNATLNGSAQLSLIVTPNTNANNEDMYIDDVVISYTPPVPTVSIGNGTLTEGSGTTMSFPVTLSATLTQDVVLTYRITHGTTSASDTILSAGTDYTYTIPSGTVAGTHAIPLVGIVDDTHVEGDETFTLTVINATNATLGTASTTGTITNDDVRTISLTPASQSVTENNTSLAMDFNVTLSNNTATANVTVNYTVTGSGSFPATAGTDVTPSSGTVTFAPGETSKTITLTIAGDTVGEADEQFTIALASPTNATLGAVSSATGTILNDDPLSADLSVTKTDSKDPVTISENFTYTLTVTNSGPSIATDLSLVDQLPEGMVYYGVNTSGWSCSFTEGKLQCFRSSLNSGASSSLIVSVTAPSVEGNITNTVAVTSATADPDAANNTASEPTEVISNSADLSVTISDSPDPVLTTGALVYTITVRNNSAVPASGIQVLDILPANLQFVSVSGADWTCSQGQYIVCDYIQNGGVLAGGATAGTIMVNVTAPAAAGSVSNMVDVSSANPDPVMANNTATATTTVNAGTSTFIGGRNFYKYLQYNVFGDMKTIGNTIIWANKNETRTSNCNITGTTPNCRNNEYTMRFADEDSDASTFNSSSATLDLGDPAYEIVWAGLYWQGHLTQASGSDNSKMGGYATAVANAPKVKLKTPSGTYVNITANSFDTINDTSYGSNLHYSGFADVTQYVTQQGEYTVGNINTTEGRMSYLGGYGGWALQVIYKDPARGLAFKNVSIFNGFKTILANGSVTIDIDGFVTPLSGPISSSVATFVTDGDKESSQPNRTDTLNTGERFQMYNGTTTTYVDIYDATSPSGNVFNSSIAELGSHFTDKDPDYRDNLGVDIDRFDVSAYVVNNQNSTRFRFSTDGDVYDVNLIAFATDMYTPIIDGFSKSATLNGQPLDANSILNPGDTLVYNLIFSNTGGETAKEVEIFDNFDYDGLSSVFNLGSFDASSIKLSVKNSTAWQGSPNCGYDSALRKVWCKIAEMETGDEYTMQFAVTIRSTFSSEDNTSVVNTAYSKYKNATTNEYVILTANGFGGQSNTNNAGTILGTLVIPEANPGRFNVVYADYANGALSSGYYYNLPTQVASRADNYKVISLHTASGFENTLRDVNTTVGVELVDYDSPGECANKQALSARAWTVFNNGSVADFSAAQIAGNYAQTAAASTKDEEFYQTAGKNVAFRISYNAASGDGDLVQTTVIPSGPQTGNIAINNFTELAQGLKAYNSHLPPNQQNKCVVPVVRGNHTYTTMPESCGNASPSNGIDLEQLSICMECVYGANTVKMCSRDTFAIRPEAYVVKLSDQNQTNPLSKSFIRDNVSGSGTLALASGYNYYTEVNATSHTDSAPVAGYDSASSELRFVWHPGAGVLSGNCNDESNQTAQLSFTNGMATALAAHDQVGEYLLNVTDTNWTMVDWNASMMAEKRSASDAGFFLGSADCMVNSSVTSAVKTTGIGANAVLVGCNIDSNHTKPATSNPSMEEITYTNIETELHPYRFDMDSLVFGAGIQPQAIGAGGEDFVYISDMSVDDNMSLRGVGSIQAKTYIGTTPSNFVAGCYAKNTKLGMNVANNLTLADTTFQVRFKTFENGGVLLYDSNAANMDTTGMSMPVIPNLGIAASIQDGNFTKTNAGAMPVDVRFNYDRNQTIRLNPMIAQFGDLNISCNNPSECSMYADLSSSHEAVGAKAMDFNITYVYGRIIPRDVRVFGSVSFTANAWYEVWQLASLLGTGLAPSRNASGWFINTLHDDTNDGDGAVTVLEVSGTPSSVNIVSTAANGMESYPFSAQTPPYSAKAHIDTNSWLWYGPNALPYADPVNASNLDCFTHPCFNINIVPAIQKAGSATTEDLKGDKENKATTPGGIQYDYSPSLR